MPTVIVDVREPFEYKMGHVKGSVNIPPSKIMTGAEKLKDVPRDELIVLYCKTGSRSNVAMNFLKQMGYTNLVNGINKDHVNANYIN